MVVNRADSTQPRRSGSKRTQTLELTHAPGRRHAQQVARPRCYAYPNERCRRRSDAVHRERFVEYYGIVGLLEARGFMVP